MDIVLTWLLRAAYVLLGLGAGIWLLRWITGAWRDAQERWPLRVALGMLLLAGVYAAGHARLLAQREELEAGIQEYARFGDPRRTEMRRAEVRGWIRDCTGEPRRALALYANNDGAIERTYPLGGATINLVGGGGEEQERDYTIERLYAEQLRKPVSLMEMGQLHPAGTDLQVTLCSDATAAAWSLLRQTGRQGAVVAQDVATGAVVAYAATGDKDDPPFGIKRYAPPGSVFKLTWAALWWDAGLPDDLEIPCPARIAVNNRGATIQNFEGRGYGNVQGPAGVLIPSCNTGAVWLGRELRRRIGDRAVIEGYERFGFVPYAETAPRDTVRNFWATESDAWSRRMNPPANRLRMSEKTGPAEWAQLSIGQGPVDVTVIGVSRFIQAIGNGGVMLRPTLEPELARDPDEGVRIMKPETSQKLMGAMLGVVDQGTAASAAPRLAGSGWDMGGKTGTAQIPARPDDGWFAGLAFDPQRRPRYTVVVYLQGGGPGGRMPAAIAAELTRVLAGQRPSGPIPRLPTQQQEDQG